MTSSKRQEFSDIKEFYLEKIQLKSENQPSIKGYYVFSTAPINVEDKFNTPDSESVKNTLLEIAKHLVEHKDSEVILSIHGYANTKLNAIDRHKKIYSYANCECHEKAPVFLGYRWPAENPVQDDSSKNILLLKLKDALLSLPTMLLTIFISMLILGLITASFLIWHFSISATLGFISLIAIVPTTLILWWGDALTLLFPLLPNVLLLLGLLLEIIAIFATFNISGIFVPLLILFFSLFAIIIALIALRLSNYSRDNYRATNYGVIDLVELIRHLDQSVIETIIAPNALSKENILALITTIKNETNENITLKDWQQASSERKIEWWGKNRRIKLNFIGHSMGCFVATNTIRTLSDVFDENSIYKNPSAEIGRVFSLARLILVAPDIPIETIIPRRSNFLAASLRRCEEAYVFSNEGDLALRLASTAANYFSFPAKTRFRGYRLGNITVKHFKEKTKTQPLVDVPIYGIVNPEYKDAPSNYLEIRASNQEHKNIEELITERGDRQLKVPLKTNLDEEVPIADLFTYFDCTDYEDIKAENVNQLLAPEIEKPELPKQKNLSKALKKSALNFSDYIQLIIAYFVYMYTNPSKYINTHGGYFEGKFSQQLIYQLAFLGLDNFLEKLTSEKVADKQIDENVPDKQIEKIHKLSEKCKKKQIQVVISRRIHDRLTQQGDVVKEASQIELLWKKNWVVH